MTTKRDATIADCIAWLDSLTLTRPFTVADAVELHRYVKSLPWSTPIKVDVHCPKGDVVFVSIDIGAERTVLEYAVV